MHSFIKVMKDVSIPPKASYKSNHRSFCIRQGNDHPPMVNLAHVYVCSGCANANQRHLPFFVRYLVLGKNLNSLGHVRQIAISPGVKSALTTHMSASTAVISGSDCTKACRSLTVHSLFLRSPAPVSVRLR